LNDIFLDGIRVKAMELQRKKRMETLVEMKMEMKMALPV
jgi:hypothetical protein